MKAAFTKLGVWMARATTEQKYRMMRKSGVALSTLRVAAATGAGFSPKRARDVENACAHIGAIGLPRILREDLNRDCANCDLAKIARKVQSDIEKE